jgi:putative NADH-flavin reductase
MRIAVIGASGWLGGAGESAISSADLAAALVDELERPQFTRRRFTAAYGS